MKLNWLVLACQSEIKVVVRIERIQRKKANGTNVYVGLHPFMCLIVKLKMNKVCKRILGRRRWTQGGVFQGQGQVHRGIGRDLCDEG
ncbi:ribosomal protein L26 [Culex quinquefasciatus]|uniref:Ribosomal protein L26 n=1 Tax=Culex quinquefasciatus TaxID=7176 RepID=B0X6N5_CULQU|nr:ribosomal protein L26 [Culex quinquefasciatus]|eukprot:XP_001865307.1 ribosomal protein L26 [Culex quinquefasciatus]